MYNEPKKMRNDIWIVGTLVSPLKFDSGRRKYYGIVRVARLSKVFDYIPIEVPELLISNLPYRDYCGKVFVEGQINDHFVKGEENRHTYVYAYDIGRSSDEDCNIVVLTGRISSKPKYRLTHTKKRICDFVLETVCGKNRSYIITIAWQREAVSFSKMRIGDYISFEGRFQSREYKKNVGTVENPEWITKTVYEVSVLKEIKD